MSEESKESQQQREGRAVFQCSPEVQQQIKTPPRRRKCGFFSQQEEGYSKSDYYLYQPTASE